ncbi:MAG: hypothetical protein DI586_06745 [Micavibrio aeruginosavorus]|uniref:Uncharacterized protein n=1 Tax=Micavibrio aeruginosavorus TaxID=349221 RepID=A0A2W5FHT6_9BACT|nr:MAG: hypothetical protein DI586_06745 [Micavibrio aeruginosavorus]
MLEPKEVEVDEYLAETAYALCDNIVNYYRDGDGTDFHYITALCAVSCLAGEMVFRSVHNLKDMQSKLYDELFVLSDEVNRIISEDQEKPTVYDCVALLAMQAGAQEADFPDWNAILEKSVEAMTQGRLMPELPLEDDQYPFDMPLGFCAETRKATDLFFKERDVQNKDEKVLVLAIAVGSLIQAIDEKNIYSMKQLLEIAFLVINFSAKVIPFDENYKDKLGL